MLRASIQPWAVGGTAAVIFVAMAAGMPPATSAGPGPASWTNPYSPAYHHPYRRGVVPTIPQQRHMRQWEDTHVMAAAAATRNLRYGGAVDGIGVTTGHEKVYLVFYGAQWGAQGATANGDVTLSGDPSAEAPYLQEMFKGLGTNSELWSGVMTQYCQGVAAAAQTCRPGKPHVAYPRGGALAGVWVDEATSSPQQASAKRLGQEAIKAAAHFGNTTASSNRDAQYVIASPTGTHPDGFGPAGSFCAWHDYNSDVGVSSPDGDIAFTNMPYVTDMGEGCGQDFVNSGSTGADDGVSIVEGHEYAETITDQNPAGGWTDSNGDENADKCAWRNPGTTGGAANLKLATGTFAMQGTWSNDANSGRGGCRFTHSIVGTELLKNPGFESGSITPWTSTPGVLRKTSATYPARSGTWLARLDGYGTVRRDTLAQTVSIPATYSGAAFSFWLKITSDDPTDQAYDTLTVQVLNSSGTVVATLATYSNLDASSDYVRHSVPLESFIGKKITLKFTGKETLANRNTAFLVDDNALNAS
jgi:serine protease